MERSAVAVSGGSLEVFSVGQGAGVVVVHGGGTDFTIYQRPAKRLAEAGFAVHVYNRRGRGASAARPADYGLATEIADLAAVLFETGATRVIGHSVGGLFAIAAARELPVERLALFDPTVSVDGGFPRDYMPDFEAAIAAGDIREAMYVVGKGLRNPGYTMPEPVLRASVRLVMMTPPGKTLARLLPTVPAETKLAIAADGAASQWAGITAATRFYIGARSPDYYLPCARQLVAVMPDADIETIPKLGHDALARAPKSLMESLARFLRPETA